MSAEFAQKGDDMENSAEIQMEFPEGLRMAEITLVKMLKQQRSWLHYMEIIGALRSLQYQAECMQKEREHLFPVGGSAGEANHE